MKILHVWKDIDSNERALATTLELAKALKSSVYLLACLDEEPQTLTSITDEKVKRISAQMRAQEQSVFTKAGLECTSDIMVSAGGCGDKIVQYVDKNKIDLLVMGIKKRSKVGKMFFGSISQQIILEAPCKVLTVK